MAYEIDYAAGERIGCSSKIVLADRIFYVKIFAKGPSKFYSGDQQGVIQKEISATEFELWVNVLADEGDIEEINNKLALGKKY